MKLILDEGLPFRAASILREAGIEAQHVLELRMGGASDEAILAKARLEGAAVATLDADFHQILAVTGADRPSVIRVRIEGLAAAPLAALLSDVVSRTRDELMTGAAISVSSNRLRLRKLPFNK
jgi:predicted nuclease of predicted toxin-antitoxin system